MREPLASGSLGISYGGDVTSAASVVRLCAVAFFLVDHSTTGDAHVLQAMPTPAQSGDYEPIKDASGAIIGVYFVGYKK